MKKVIIICIALIGLLKADENVMKLVLDLTTSDVVKFERTILKGIALNKARYERQFKELEVVVVIHGGAYKFFIKDLNFSQYKDDKKLLKVSKEFLSRIKSLHNTYDVKFLMCKAGMDARGISKEDILDVVELTPNAMIGLIDAQNNGSAYMPVK